MITCVYFYLPVFTCNSQEDPDDPDDIQVCRESLEVLTVCLSLYPAAIEVLNKDRAWQIFIIDILLLSRSR